VVPVVISLYYTTRRQSKLALYPLSDFADLFNGSEVSTMSKIGIQHHPCHQVLQVPLWKSHTKGRKSILFVLAWTLFAIISFPSHYFQSHIIYSCTCMFTIVQSNMAVLEKVKLSIIYIYQCKVNSLHNASLLWWISIFLMPDYSFFHGRTLTVAYSTLCGTSQ
jgi:hypothetical protein